MKLQKYEICIFCKSTKMKLYKKQSFTHNFYTNAIKNDFGLKDIFFKKMKVYYCDNCFVLQNNPWFSKKASFKIFNQIYGQHNRNWSNIINFFHKGMTPNHGRLFEIISKNIKINKYCEFNAPFMGLMLDFFCNEYKKNKNFYKKIFNYSINYLSSRQVAGLNKSKLNEKLIRAKKYFNKLNKLKKKNHLNKIINKTVIIDNSYLSWLYNDNYKSVNSRSLASELFDIEIEDLNLAKKSKKYDLFGIFHTLDHTHQPKRVLNYALNNSRYVLIYCHSDDSLEKQHLFTFTDNFFAYLEKNKIFCQNLNLMIDKKFRSKEIYILCSKYNKVNFKYKK